MTESITIKTVTYMRTGSDPIEKRSAEPTCVGEAVMVSMSPELGGTDR